MTAIAKVPRFTQTQFGNADRFAHRNGDDVRFCYAWKKWLVWDGRCWRLDNHGEVERRAKQVVRAIRSEARAASSARKDALLRFATKSESKYNVDAMIELARSENGIPVSPEDLDRDTSLLNVLNGTVDLRTGKLRQHDRSDHISKLANVNFKRNAKCPVFVAFLEKIFAGDQGVIRYVQRAVGYTLTGGDTEKAVFVLVGGGDNGKTTLLEALRYVMGDYAAAILVEVLMQSGQTSERQYAIADLLGKRFVTTSEAEEGQRLKEGTLKQLTGMGRQVGRRIYGSPFEFDPRFKLFLDANQKPVIRGQDNAIWNRIRLIPFNVSIPKAEQDRDLAKKLRDEAEGILAWAVRGCQEWLANGLGTCDAVTAAVAGYRSDMDLVAEFIAEKCQTDASHSVSFSTLYAAFSDWCKELGEQPISLTSVGLRLTEKGFAAVRQSGRRVRSGLRLRGFPVP
jgi:putative DNA primase/helicase